MNIEETIREQAKVALKARQKQRLAVLRMLLSELKVAELSGAEYDELQVVKAYAKKLRKNVAEYENLNLPDRAEESRAELAIVGEFLPQQMGREQIEALVETAVKEHDYGPGDLGRLMKQIISEHGDSVDGRLVHQIAREKLSERQ